MITMEKASSIFNILKISSERYPTKLFMQIKRDGDYIRYTYKETYRMAVSLGNSLSDEINKNDKAAILSENRPEWMISYLAISYLGAVVVPLDTNHNDEALYNLLKNSDAKLIFISKTFADKIGKVKQNLSKLRILCFDDLEFREILGGTSDKEIQRDVSLDDAASLIYTSGTTGKPKGIILTNRNFFYQLKAGSKKVDFSDKDVLLLILPLYHIFSFATVFLFSMYLGASITIVNTLKRDDIIDGIKETNATILVAVPIFFEFIYNSILRRIEEQPKSKKFLVKVLSTANKTATGTLNLNFGKKLFSKIHDAIGSSIRIMISGGAAMKKEVLAGMRSLGFTIIEGYGLTETSPVVSLNTIKDLRIGSVGKPLEGVEVKIINKNDNGIGEILVKGPVVMKGYYKNDELTRKSIEDGWLHTKDLGYIDDEGYLYIKGRSDDVIILPNGKNIYPEELEQHYSKSNLVKEICIVGKEENSHKKLHALIIPDKDELDRAGIRDIGQAIKEEVEKYSSELPYYKRLYSYKIAEENSLPKTSTLKFKRKEIINNMKTKISHGNKKPIETEIGDKMANEQSIISILKRISGKDDITMESHLELDLKLDSLTISEIISNIENKFKIKINYDINTRMNKVKDLVAFVNRHLGSNISVEKLADADIESGIPRRMDFSEEGREERVRWISKLKQAEFGHMRGKQTKAEMLKGNIEHYIGMNQIPTGIAGPIKVNGEFAKGEFYVPFATTEGALVASVNRGMNIITKSGGANARVLNEQITKAPMFIFKNGEEAIKFKGWVDNNYDKIKTAAESTTKHGKLIKIDKYLLGRRTILRLCFDSGDAMGANMITMATQKAVNFMKNNYDMEDSMLQCNLEGEKKASFLNFFSGRGKKVYADVTIPRKIIENFLHITPEKIADVAKNSLYGSIASGMMGTNAHIANIVTAIFIATGQDVAHAHDSSIGITTIDLTKDKNLYVSINLPSLAVGTIGGGTGLGTQKECLEIMDCYGSRKAKKFAEIVAACVLAGEISLAGSQAAGDFAFTHNKFGRNRPGEN